MARRGWVYLATCLTLVAYVTSLQENDAEQFQNGDSETFTALGNLRTTRSRNAQGISEDIENERELQREERKRIKAERRRLKEERRLERWSRRRQHKQDGGPRGRLAITTEDGIDYDDAERDDLPIHQPQHHQGMTSSSGGPVTLSNNPSEGSSGHSGGLPAARSHTGHNSDPLLARSFRGGSSGANNNVDIESPPTVVDLEWMRANLSSLWTVVKALSRQQGRTVFHRGGGRGRHHHSGVVNPPNPAACPGEGDTACRSEGGEVCGGQGSCTCGHCFCHPGYYGTFCQCNDHACPLYDGMTCGGPSRGQCRCGGCICRPGYAGDSCDCPTDTQTCTAPDSDVICSGNGNCVCGRCRCGDGHKGMYCEDNVYAAGVCEKLKSCVMCRAWNRDLPSCASCQITVTEVDSLEPSMTTCVMVNSGCLLQFSYIPQAADAYTVLVPRDMVCPT